MKAHVRYEAAFEDFVRHRGFPCVPVDQAKRAAFRDTRLRSFDFIVSSGSGTRWLVDVKGRRWKSRNGRKPIWENWLTQADLDAMRQWQELFGGDFRALFVFAYSLDPGDDPPREIVYPFRGRRYVFAGVPLDDYERHARVRSPKWKTVSMPTAEFIHHVRTIDEWP